MFVRKYDPPMMINILQQENLMGEMLDIININSGNRMSEVTSDAVIKHVKDNLDEMGGFVDVMKFYNTK
jgi:hypothetical protein